MRLIDITDGGRQGHPPGAATGARPAGAAPSPAAEDTGARSGRGVTVTAAGPSRPGAVTSMAPFRIPEGAEAGTPAELRGATAEIGADGRAAVRLMVAHRAGTTVEHLPFGRLSDALAPGDVLVVNTSAVVPAALDARPAEAGGPDLRLHLSTEQPGGFWVVEPRRPAGAGTDRLVGTPPTRLVLPGGNDPPGKRRNLQTRSSVIAHPGKERSAWRVSP